MTWATKVPLSGLEVKQPSGGAFPAGTSVAIYLRGTTTPITIYPTSTGGTPQPNPTPISASGNLTGFADPQQVTVLANGVSVDMELEPSAPDLAPIVAPAFTGPLTLDGSPLSSSAPDATTSSKGIVQLAGDLAGTAAAPTVPGLAAKAPLASPALTGTPTAPTPTTGDADTSIATTAFVQTAAQLVTTGALPADRALMSLDASTTTDLAAIAAAGYTHVMCGTGWDNMQASAGAALTSGTVTSLITAIQNALTYNLIPVLDFGMQYAPTWVTAAVELFKDEAGTTFTPGGAGSGLSVANWVWTATGQGYVADYLTKLITALGANNVTDRNGDTVTALSVLGGVRAGGGFFGEIHYPNGEQLTVTQNGTSYTGGTTLTLTATVAALGSRGVLLSSDGSTVFAYTSRSSAVLTGSRISSGTPTVTGGTTWTMVSFWGYGTSQQTGTGLATGQVVCPNPGYVPFSGPSQSQANDAAWFAWYFGGLANFLAFQLSTIRTAGYTGNIWVLHPDHGIRYSTPPPVTTTSSTNLQFYLRQAAYGQDHARMVRVYGSNSGFAYGTNVYPDCTAVDDNITSNFATPGTWTNVTEPAWSWLLRIAQGQGVAGKIAGENAGTPVDWANTFLGPGKHYWMLAALASAPTGQAANAASVKQQALGVNGTSLATTNLPTFTSTQITLTSGAGQWQNTGSTDVIATIQTIYTAWNTSSGFMLGLGKTQAAATSAASGYGGSPSANITTAGIQSVTVKVPAGQWVAVSHFGTITVTNCYILTTTC